MLTACIFCRDMKAQPQRPILGLPPLPSWGKFATDESQLTIPDATATVLPDPPMTIMFPEQQSQGSLPASSPIELPDKPTFFQLADFRCRFDRVLGYILCELHEVLIPASLLRTHLSQKHMGDFSAHKDINLIVNNLLLSLKPLYGLDPSQGHPDPKWELLYPIHKRVYAGKRCSQCPTFFYASKAQRTQYGVHWDTSHSEMKKDDWSTLEYFDKLHQPFEIKKLYLIPGQSSFQPPHSATASVAGLESPKLPLQALDPPPPKFCQELGFISWVEPLGQYQVVLNYLTATPGTKATKNTSGKKAQLEATLLQVHIFLDTYLSSGQNWLFVYHSRLHEILGKRYYSDFTAFLLPIELTSFSFRNSDGRVLGYRRYKLFLSMVISSFIRAYHLEEIGELPSGLIVNITEDQSNARKNLYLAAFTGQGPSDRILAQMVHTLCDSFLRASTPLDKIFGPVEFTFCLFLRQRDGRYRPINHLTAFFAGMQWCLRMILAHTIRLCHSKISLYTPYIPLVAVPTSVIPSTVHPSCSTENVLSQTGTLERDLLEDAVADSWMVRGHEDDLEVVLDCLDDLEDSGGDGTLPEFFRDIEKVMDQEITSFRPHGLTSLGDQIISQDSEGLLKWVDLGLLLTW